MLTSFVFTLNICFLCIECKEKDEFLNGVVFSPHNDVNLFVEIHAALSSYSASGCMTHVVISASISCEYCINIM